MCSSPQLPCGHIRTGLWLKVVFAAHEMRPYKRLKVLKISLLLSLQLCASLSFQIAPYAGHPTIHLRLLAAAKGAQVDAFPKFFHSFGASLRWRALVAR